MIISDKYKLIFIRIPKTGSTSMEEFLIKNDPNCISSKDFPAPPFGHQKCYKLRKIVGEEKWNTYFKFAIIREPISWYKSRYADQLNYNHPSHTELHILLNEQFKIPFPVDKNILDVEHIMKSWVYFSSWENGENQSKYLNLPIDFIGKLEDIDAVIMMLKERFNLDYSLECLNKTGSSKLSVSPRARKILEVLLEDDFNLYNSV